MQILPHRLPDVGSDRMRLLALRGWAFEWVNRQQTNSVRTHRPGVKFDSRSVTVEYLLWVWHAQHGKCALSGRLMVIPNWRTVGVGCTVRAPRNAHNASVDRVDSTRGYEAGNIQLVCYAVNVMKTNMSDAEFRAWCADVVNTR